VSCKVGFEAISGKHRHLTYHVAVIKPPIAKIADAFGRLEAFSIAILLYIIGYIQMAASRNVQTYAAAQIFYSSGSTALQILQQIFIADTSDLLNRALLSTLPDLPFLATVWIGPVIGDSILSHTTWRLGYGLWSIVLPAAFLPFAMSLFLNTRRAAQLDLLPISPYAGKPFIKQLKLFWFEVDLFGLLLLSAALSLILIPLTLAARAKGGWSNHSVVAMLVIGCLCLIAFPVWDTNKRLAPRPLLTLRLFKERTVLAGCALAFFYFSKFSPKHLGQG
jgi:MFS family permease